MGVRSVYLTKMLHAHMHPAAPQKTFSLPCENQAHLIQTRQHMTQVQNRLVIVIHLMEHHIPEEFQDVPITRLGPPRIMVKLGPLIDEAKLAEESDKTAVLEFAGHFGLEYVDVAGRGKIERQVKRREEGKANTNEKRRTSG